MRVAPPPEESWKVVVPPANPGAVPPLLMMVTPLAADSPVKTNAPELPPADSAGSTVKVCGDPVRASILRIPKPVKVSDVPARQVILYLRRYRNYSAQRSQ